MNSILAAIVNGSIVSVVLTTVVWAALCVIPRPSLPAAARYVVWWAVLIATGLLPLAYVRLPAATVAAPPTTPISAVLRSPATPAAIPAVIPGAAPRATTPAVTPIFPVVLVAGAWARWIFAAWAALATLMLLRLGLSCLLLQRRKRGAIAAPAQLIERVEGWMASRRNVQVLCSSSLRIPVVAGLRQPAILIPARLLAELREEELEQVALHEAAHVARRDDYILLLQRVFEALFVIHPVVRWITSRIDLEREIACDDAVVDSLGQPRQYAACLTRIVELCGGVRTSWAGAGVAGDHSHLTRRIDQLLDRRRQIGARHGKARLALAVALVAALACVAGRTPRAIVLAMPIAAPPAATAIAQSPEVVEAPAEAVPAVAEAPASPAPPQTPAPSSAVPPVTVNVFVTDAGRRSVGGLAKESFRVLEDGVQEQISDFAAANIALSVGIVMDASGSMRNNRAVVNQAVWQMVSTANPLDEFFLVTANDEIRLASGFTNDATQIRDQADQAESRGGTALRDGIFRAAQAMNDAKNPRRFLLVISDGNDNASSANRDQLREAVLAAKLPVFAITLADPANYPRRGSDWLAELTEQTRGHEFVTNDWSEIPNLAASLAVNTMYTIQYRSANAVRDGRFRQIRVEIAGPQALGLTVEHRSGYYADKL